MTTSRRVVGMGGLATFVALVACSGTTIGGGGSGTATGMVAGMTFAVESEIGINGPASSDSSCVGSTDGGTGMCTTSSSGQGVGVLLTNRAAATCGLLQSTNPDTNFASFAYLQLGVTNATGTVGPGTYAISTDGTGAGAQFANSSATCQQELQLPASSGSITLTEVSSTTVAGTYDVTFGTQGSYSGSFNSTVCTLPDGGVSGGGSTTCQP